MLFDPRSLKLLSSVTDTREFGDPLQSVTFSLTFTVDPSHAQDESIKQAAADLIEKWVTGDAEYVNTKKLEKPRGNAPDVPQVPIGAGAIQPVVQIDDCYKIARYQEAQRLANVPVTAEAEWLMVLCAMPTAWDDVWAWYNNLVSEARGYQGNEWRASAGTTSQTPSTTTQDTIPS